MPIVKWHIVSENFSQVLISLSVYDHIEIWDLERWNEYKEKSNEEFEINAEGLLDLDEN